MCHDEYPASGSNGELPPYPLDELAIQAKVQAIADYVRAEGVERSLRYMGDTYWRVADGHVVQIELDDDPWGDSDLKSLANKYGLLMSGDTSLKKEVLPKQDEIGICETGNLFPSSHASKDLIARIGYQLLKRLRGAKPDGTPDDTTTNNYDKTEEIKGQDLSIGYIKDHPVLNIGSEQISLGFKEVDIRDGVAHAVARGPSGGPLKLKISILDDVQVRSGIADREKYQAAVGIIYKTKSSMIESLRSVGKDLLLYYGAKKLLLDRDLNHSVFTQGTPEYVTFDFDLDSLKVTLRVSNKRIQVNAAHDDTYRAFKLYLRYSTGIEARDDRVASSVSPSDFDEGLYPYDDPRSLPDRVRDDFVANGCRFFYVEYDNLADALSAIVKLLKAPIDSNHEVLTPMFYGFGEPLKIQILDPNRLRTISEGELIAYFTVNNDGELIEDVPEL